jgi:hypothetical protein
VVEHCWAHAGKEFGDWSGEVLPVEFVDPVPSHFGGLHDPFVNKTGQAATDSDLRTSHNLLRDVTYRQRATSRSENGEDWAVQGWSYRPGGV